MNLKHDIAAFGISFSEKMEEIFSSYRREGVPEIDEFYNMMAYSLFGEGKRLRPFLMYKTFKTFSGEDDETCLKFAFALESIHTYSLVHDDLPAMDDDDYRRGKLSSHMAFGEDMAILAGDALLNLAFEIMLKTTLGSAAKSASDILFKLKAMEIIASSSGANGMVGGQVLELFEEGKLRGSSLKIEELKTSKLFIAAILAGAYLAGVDEAKISILRSYALHLGIVFQLTDDILDEEQDADTKFVATNHYKKACSEIDRLGLKDRFYQDLALHILNRVK